MPERILFLRPGALGDAVVTMPVLDALSGRDVAVAGHPVFRMHPSCRAWMPFDDPRLLGLYSEGEDCRAVRGFDTCVLIARHPDPRLASNVRRNGVGQFIFHSCEPQPGVHITDHLLRVLQPLGLEATSRAARLAPRDNWAEAGKRVLAGRGVKEEFVVLHPGSGGPTKRWPLNRFAELASRLARQVVWVLGPAEQDDDEARAVGAGTGTVVDRLGLEELSGVLAACRLYVGNDSGVSHLAAALGAPTVAVFGTTDPAVWAPRGSHVAIVSGWQKGGLDAVTVDDVAAASRRCGTS